MTVGKVKGKDGKVMCWKEVSKHVKKSDKIRRYISPWDRNHPKYGTPSTTMFCEQDQEIFQNSGPFGNSGGLALRRRKQMEKNKVRVEKIWKYSEAIIAKDKVCSDIGPDIRWCGNWKWYGGKNQWVTSTHCMDLVEALRSANRYPEPGKCFGKNWRLKNVMWHCPEVSESES